MNHIKQLAVIWGAAIISGVAALAFVNYCINSTIG